MAVGSSASGSGKTTASSRCFLPLIAVLLTVTPSALAIDEFTADLRLVRALNGIEMHDYTLLQLDLMLGRYPDRRDLLLVEQARALHLSGKSSLAQEAIRGITPASPHYGRSRLLVGEIAWRRRDSAAADEALAAYFSKVSAPAADDSESVEEFKRAVRLYARILEQQGKGEEAAKVMGYLGRIRGGSAASDRQLTFLKAQSILAAEEAKFSARKAVDAQAVARALDMLKGLQWELDGVAAAAFVETARAYVVLDEHAKAIEVLRLGTEFMSQVEQTLARDRNMAASPLAGALFYYAKALKGEARAAFKKKKQAEARQALVGAAKRFYKVTRDYAGSPYTTKAMAEFGKCKNLLESEFGAKVELSRGGRSAELELKMQQANSSLAAGNYADALPICLETVRDGRTSQALPAAAGKLIVCNAKLGRFLEAEAVASHLTELFPKAQETADAIYRLGALIYHSADAAENSKERDRLRARAAQAWEPLVTVCSFHPRVADVAFLIAEEQYRVASEAAKAASRLKARGRKEKAKVRAREAFLAAAASYERVVGRFGSTQKGIRALYKLGWIHYSTERPREAIDAFLRYCELESDRKYSSDRLEAKFRVAELLMLNDAAPDAVEHFTELLAWLEDAGAHGLDVKSKSAKRIAEDAASYRAWSYDLAGEEMRAALDEFARQIQVEKDAIAETAEVLRETERALARSAKAVDRAKADFAEIERSTASPSGAGEPLNHASAETSTAAGGMAPRAELANERRLAAAAASQARTRLEGERIGYERERDAVKSARTAAARRQQVLESDLAKAREELTQAAEARAAAAAEFGANVAPLENARRAVAEAEQEERELEAQELELQEAQHNGDHEARSQAEAELQRISAALKAARQERASAHVTLADVVTPEAELKEAKLAEQLRLRNDEASGAERHVRELVEAKRLADKECELLQARLVAVAKALRRNKGLAKAGRPASTGGEQGQDALKKLSDEMLAAFRTVMEKRIEKAVLMQTGTRERSALARQRASQAEERIKAIEEARQPVQLVFDNWKRKAQAEFVAFLNKHGRSRHVPDNMARLGTVYLEFGEFDKAADVLNRLADGFPDSKAGREALFNLGRAQCELGRYGEAAQAFERLLKRPQDVRSRNLSYVSAKMLEAEYPRLCLAASREILKRSEDAGGDEYEALRQAPREHALFRAGEASFELNELDESLEFFRRLLDEKSNSAYFFQAKLKMGLGKRKKTPPDYNGAMRDFSEILQHAQEAALSNQTLCRLGETLAMTGERESLTLAAARFQQVVLLADPDLPENQPWIELATYESARCFARLGNVGERDKAVSRYRTLYPQGKYAEALNALPKAEFASTPAK